MFSFVFRFLNIWQMSGQWRIKYSCDFQVVTPEKYEVKGSIEEAAIVLTACAEPKMQVTITLTSPVIREESGRDGGWKPITALPPSLLFVSPLSCSLSLSIKTSFSMWVDPLPPPRRAACCWPSCFLLFLLFKLQK